MRCWEGGERAKDLVKMSIPPRMALIYDFKMRQDRKDSLSNNRTVTRHSRCIYDKHDTSRIVQVLGKLSAQAWVAWYVDKSERTPRSRGTV